MAIGRLSPLAPVRLPEFGASPSWLMCRNALCPNFGVSYDGPQPEGRVKSVSDARYRLDLAEGRGKCHHCHLSFQMLPNLSIRLWHLNQGKMSLAQAQSCATKRNHYSLGGHHALADARPDLGSCCI